MLIADRSTIVAARLVLASGSPRREQILNHILKLEARVVPSTFGEDLDKSGIGDEKSAIPTPQIYAEETARRKAVQVFQDMALAGDMPSCVIGADTVVVLDGKILEKPSDEADATRMLEALSGSTHQVCTGCALVYAAGAKQFSETTEVRFAKLDAADIAAYVASGEPMDKAGGYGIQGLGGAFVESITGCYYNVMGFPMHRFCAEVRAERKRPTLRPTHTLLTVVCPRSQLDVTKLGVQQPGERVTLERD